MGDAAGDATGSAAGNAAGMERQPRNYFLQDVPHVRANTFPGMERQPETTCCRTFHIFE